MPPIEEKPKNIHGSAAKPDRMQRQRSFSIFERALNGDGPCGQAQKGSCVRVALMKESSDCILLADPQSKHILDANPALSRLLGFDPTTLYDFIGHDRTSIDRSISEIIEGGKEFHGERNFFRKDHTPVVMDVKACSVTFDDETALFMVARDLTARRNLEDEKRQSEREWAASSIAAGIAHDLSNALTILYSNMSCLKEELSKTDKTKINFPAFTSSGNAQEETLPWKCLVDIEAAYERMAALNRQLGEVSRGAVYSDHVSLSRLVKNSVFFAASYNVRVIFDIPEKLWAARADGVQLARVFDNLYRNAGQAITENGIENGSISVSLENVAIEENNKQRLKPGNYVRVSVRDNGGGISEENLQNLFKSRFTTRKQCGGSGIGLMICKYIVEEHGGLINVESRKGEGATFQVYLPASEEKISDEKGVTGEYPPRK